MNKNWIGQMVVTTDTEVRDNLGNKRYDLVLCDGTRFTPEERPLLAAVTTPTIKNASFDVLSKYPSGQIQTARATSYGWTLSESTGGNATLIRTANKTKHYVPVPEWDIVAGKRGGSFLAGTLTNSKIYIPTTGKDIYALDKETLEVETIDSGDFYYKKLTAMSQDGEEVLLYCDENGNGTIIANGVRSSFLDGGDLASCDGVIAKSSAAISLDKGTSWINTGLGNIEQIAVMKIGDVITIVSPNILGGGVWSDDEFITTNPLNGLVEGDVAPYPVSSKMQNGGFMIPGKVIAYTADGKNFSTFDTDAPSFVSGGINPEKNYAVIIDASEDSNAYVFITPELYYQYPDVLSFTSNYDFKLVVEPDVIVADAVLLNKSELGDIGDIVYVVEGSENSEQLTAADSTVTNSLLELGISFNGQRYPELLKIYPDATTPDVTVESIPGQRAMVVADL